jgi:multicomponent Na+:H+ antiporter subunit D
MNDLAVAVFAAPLGAGAVGVLLRHHRTQQRLLSFTVLIGVVASSVMLVAGTSDASAFSVDIGGFPRGLAIVLGVDILSALMLTIGSIMTLIGVAFAAASGEDAHPLFHPLVMFLWTGVALSFVTADVFNLFVAFEVMLIASYVLLTLRGGREQVRAGAIYVGTNLLA